MLSMEGTLQLVDNIRSGRDVQRSQEDLYRCVRAALLNRIQKKIPKRLSARVDTEDILHDAFLRAMAGLDLFEAKTEGSFYAWVYSIAKNLVIDRGRKRSAGVLHFARGRSDEGPRASRILSPHRRAESLIQQRDWLEVHLGRLKKKEAEVVRLHHLEGLSFAEIGDRWQKTPAAVQRFYSRVVEKLRSLAGDEGRKEEP